MRNSGAVSAISRTECTIRVGEHVIYSVRVRNKEGEAMADVMSDNLCLYSINGHK
jgi:hypothetical protein